MSVFNIKIDFEKSKGSYVFDKNTNRSYLDFMGMYSSLPIGYNHSIFDDSFANEIKKITSVLRRIVSSSGGDGVHILTARAAYKPIRQYLKDIGINMSKIYVTALASNNPKDKGPFPEYLLWYHNDELIKMEFKNPKDKKTVIILRNDWNL